MPNCLFFSHGFLLNLMISNSISLNTFLYVTFSTRQCFSYRPLLAYLLMNSLVSVLLLAGKYRMTIVRTRLNLDWTQHPAVLRESILKLNDAEPIIPAGTNMSTSQLALAIPLRTNGTRSPSVRKILDQEQSYRLHI